MSSNFLALLPILISVIAVAAKNEILGSSIRDLINIEDQDLASFLTQQSEAEQKRHRGLGEDRLFGQRCGNRNKCVEGQDCVGVNMGNRCLPNSCLQEHAELLTNGFDADTFKDDMYRTAGYSEKEIFAALETAKDERKFLETPEFQALQAALHANLEPLKRVQQLGATCIGPYQDAGPISYIGMHIEASALFDASIQYLVTSNPADANDQRSILRMCLGAELGVGAEIAYIFGFANTNATGNMLCGSYYADLDIVLLVAAGVAIGIGFNGVFFYEFTFGGGIGFGLGNGICAGFQYGNATVINETIAL